MSLQQIREMPISDLTDILAFFKLKKKREDLQARRNAQRRGKY